MKHKYYETLFTDSIRKMQEKSGSRKTYEKMENGFRENSELSQDEASFISQRDSFYMASVNEGGWPYVQHRGGPVGFIKVVSNKKIAFADYSGNRQYITVGNIKKDNRVSIIMVDYPNQARLKVVGTVNLIDKDHPDFQKALDQDYRAKVERVFLVDIIGFDWNCPQHITPRYTVGQIEELQKLHTKT